MDKIIRDPRHLATVLRASRKAAAMTQTDAGKRVGLQQKTVSRLESEQLGACEVDSFFKLLAALELELVVRPKDQGINSTPGSW
jgi:HTH-type transcriptional regulator/antitoxin HipB